MPYLPKEQKDLLINGIDAHLPGHLNYEFTVLINEYVRNKGLSYQVLNDIIGALECAKMEFYRRIIIPYENKKISENGDVYD